MREVRSRAPGKLILLGEHSVVYGRPAIAVPVHGLFTEAMARNGSEGSGITIYASDLNQTITSFETADHPLVQTVRQVFAQTNSPKTDLEIHLSSTIPMASGFGSGAAVSVAIVQALNDLLGLGLSASEISAIVYETEKIHHGTPSGIDNTVIALGESIYFVRNEEPRPISVAKRFLLVIGDTGVPVATHIPVSQVRENWLAAPEKFEALFDGIGRLVDEAVDALAEGNMSNVGKLMTANHAALVQMGVSSKLLDTLVDAALKAGALGAKLSGAGQGGNMIALVTEDSVDAVSAAMLERGATATYRTWVE